MKNVITASQCERAVCCPGHLTLDWIRTPSSAAAKRGTHGHEYIERYLLSHDPHTRGARWPECINIDGIRSEIAGSEVHVEFPMWYGAKGGQAAWLTNTKNRNYPEPTNIFDTFGTADLVVIGDPIVVIDWKSIGRSIEETSSRLGKASDSWQMRHLSLMVSRIFNKDRILPRWGYLDRNGDVILEGDTVLTAIDLDYTADCILESIETGAQRFVEGDHCRYCPATLACPLKGAA